jgi:DNA topoisomerase-3
MPEQDEENDAEQTLPDLTDGEATTLTDPKVEAKRTQPPPRYSEGTLVEAMQNAWRFVKDPELRERLKEAKGIGTPATRAEIIKGLKRQSLLTADSKFVVPTSGGLQIFELLREAAPSLVDPATTAIWEMRLDEIVAGRTDFRAVIDGIAAMAGQLIEILRGYPGSTVELGMSTDTTGRGRGQAPGKGRVRKRTVDTTSGTQSPHRRRSSKPSRSTAAAVIDPPPNPPDRAVKAGGAAPTAKMVAYAKSLASNKNVPLPPRYDQEFETCRRFLDQHSR